MTINAPQLVGVVQSLRRYPIKSMMGETRVTVTVTTRGIAGDRAYALIDAATGNIASAKRPQLWRGLLGCTARTQDATGEVSVQLPGGSQHKAGDSVLDHLLSSLTGRGVWLEQTPPAGAALERSHPEAVLAEGLDAEVGMDGLTIGQGAPAGTFMDYAPLHLITSATLSSLSAGLQGAPLEPERYRPNIIIESAPDASSFPENGWIDGMLRIGASVTLRVILASPRCAIPALAHGALPPRPEALRTAIERNRVDIPGFGNQPCAGVYAAVEREGMISAGDEVVFTAA
jgi:uncharacterized protein